eukprot:c1423_g1_i2.p1 GENE.c1423_g1_i2~~c1423_g1_i2.p1  ORF type:complete len:137 (+),score=17.51 c1423_g1_i2:34-444(+)
MFRSVQQARQLLTSPLVSLRNATNRFAKRPSQPTVYFPEAIFKLRPVTPGETVNKVVFVVPKNLSKPEIKDYLEKIYNIGVEAVNTYVAQGKLKRTMRGTFQRRPDRKKAIVTLSEPWTAPIPPPPPPKQDKAAAK